MTLVNFDAANLLIEDADANTTMPQYHREGHNQPQWHGPWWDDTIIRVSTTDPNIEVNNVIYVFSEGNITIDDYNDVLLRWRLQHCCARCLWHCGPWHQIPWCCPPPWHCCPRCRCMHCCHPWQYFLQSYGTQCHCHVGYRWHRPMQCIPQHCWLALTSVTL